MCGLSADISGLQIYTWRLRGLQVFQHFGANFRINVTCCEESVLWEEDDLLCRDALNPRWACVRPASRCAKLGIRQQTLMEVLNSFIARCSAWREIHQTGAARREDHSTAFQNHRAALKTSLVSALLFTQATAGGLQPGAGFLDCCPWDHPHVFSPFSFLKLWASL